MLATVGASKAVHKAICIPHEEYGMAGFMCASTPREVMTDGGGSRPKTFAFAA